MEYRYDPFTFSLFAYLHLSESLVVYGWMLFLSSLITYVFIRGQHPLDPGGLPAPAGEGSAWWGQGGQLDCAQLGDVPTGHLTQGPLGREAQDLSEGGLGSGAATRVRQVFPPLTRLLGPGARSPGFSAV